MSQHIMSRKPCPDERTYLPDQVWKLPKFNSAPVALAATPAMKTLVLPVNYNEVFQY